MGKKLFHRQTKICIIISDMLFAVLILYFTAGGGVITPETNSFDLGGFINFSMFETNMKEKTPISSLSISARLGYSPTDKIMVYGFSGIRTFSPLDPIPTLNQFGIGIKTSLLDKKRGANLNIDGNVEILPFLDKTDRKRFPNAIMWQVAPNMSFKLAYSLIYFGAGYRDFYIKLEDGNALKARSNSKFFVFVGGDYYINPQTYITLELHSFGQSSIFAGISYRF